MRPPRPGGSIGACPRLPQVLTPRTRSRQAVLDAVPTGLFIGGSWRPAASGATLAVDDPATGKTLVEVATRRPTTGGPRSTPPSPPSPGFAAMPPRERGEILRRAYELITDAGRRPRPAHDPGDGQAARRVQGRDRLRRGVLPLVRRGGRAHRRPVRAGPERREPLPGHAPARRRLPADHAVELPDGHGHPQDRPGGRRRLHDGDQARAADPAVDARPRRDPRRGRACPTACSTSSPPATPAR